MEKEIIYSSTNIHYSFIDRIKILLGWHTNLSITILTDNPENVIKINKTESTVYIVKPSWFPNFKKVRRYTDEILQPNKVG